jgi:hypothetical protein
MNVNYSSSRGACARVPLRKTKNCAGHGAPWGRGEGVYSHGVCATGGLRMADMKGGLTAKGRGEGAFNHSERVEHRESAGFLVQRALANGTLRQGKARKGTIGHDIREILFLVFAEGSRCAIPRAARETGVLAHVSLQTAHGSRGWRKPCHCTAWYRLGTAWNALYGVFWGLYVFHGVFAHGHYGEVWGLLIRRFSPHGAACRRLPPAFSTCFFWSLVFAQGHHGDGARTLYYGETPPAFAQKLRPRVRGFAEENRMSATRGAKMIRLYSAPFGCIRLHSAFSGVFSAGPGAMARLQRAGMSTNQPRTKTKGKIV